MNIILSRQYCAAVIAVALLVFRKDAEKGWFSLESRTGLRFLRMWIGELGASVPNFASAYKVIFSCILLFVGRSFPNLACRTR